MKRQKSLPSSESTKWKDRWAVNDDDDGVFLFVGP